MLEKSIGVILTCQECNQVPSRTGTDLMRMVCEHFVQTRHLTFALELREMNQRERWYLKEMGVPENDLGAIAG